MGKNIAAFVEIKARGFPTEIYHPFASDIIFPRDHIFFYLLGGLSYTLDGVQGILPVSLPKGLPNDLNAITREDNWDYVQQGGFNASWMYLYELEEVHRRYTQLRAMGEHTTSIETLIRLAAIIEMMRVLNQEIPDHTRFVFWFD
jgi:hypothetical protein